ncbi:MAG: GspH/FimT family pseudopilin [Gammaproteobacteria bacterium]|nr:GspH/FimT family pseudopilin [Gammaproteobacteria bacterium]
MSHKALNIYHDGFTLIELLLTVVIALIIAVFSFISLDHLWQGAQSNTIRRSILYAIYSARSSASSRDEKAIICKSADGVACDGSWQQGLIVQSQSGKLLHALQFKHYAGIVFARLFPRGRDKLVFLPNGKTEVENGTFWYCFAHANDPHWALVINRAGRVRTVFPDKNGMILDSHHKRLVCSS